VLDEQLTDNDPAFYDVQSHRLLVLFISLTEFYPILWIFFECNKTVIFPHVVHRPVIKVAFTIDQQVRIPIYVHASELLHNRI